MSQHHSGDSIDGFVLKELLGEGAYATAWLALDFHGQGEVVIKFPNPDLIADPQLYARFNRERRLALQLDHPNVQRALPIPKQASEPYFVYEYAAGRTLRALLYERGRLSLEEALDLGYQIAAGLGYLHAHGIVHRDLKPENLIVSPNQVVKISDFGSAVSLGVRRLTWKHFTPAQGTPDYMSPEQIRGLRGDARSDIYSWGVIMYEMLAGVVPFQGDNWLAVMAGHLQETPKPIRERNAKVPAEIEAIVMHSFRRYPEHRYQSAAELLGDLANPTQLKAGVYELSPEVPMGESQPSTTRSYLRQAGLVAVGFVSAVLVVIAVAIVFK